MKALLLGTIFLCSTSFAKELPKTNTIVDSKETKQYKEGDKLCDGSVFHGGLWIEPKVKLKCK